MTQNSLHLSFITIRVNTVRCSKAPQLSWVTSILDLGKGAVREAGRWRRLAPHHHHPHPSRHPAHTYMHTSPLPPKFSRHLLRGGVIVTEQHSLPACNFSLLSFLHLPHFLRQLHLYFWESALHESYTCSRSLSLYLSLPLSLSSPTFATFSPLSVYSHIHLPLVFVSAPLSLFHFPLFLQHLLPCCNFSYPPYPGVFDVFHLAWIICLISTHLTPSTLQHTYFNILR